STVVDAHGHVHGGVEAGLLLGDAQLLDDAAPQPRGTARPPDTYPDRAEVIDLAANRVPVEPHQETHLVRAAFPVLGGERVHRQPLDAQFHRAAGHVDHHGLAALVLFDAGQSPLIGPAAVAVHHDRDLPGNHLPRDLRLSVAGRMRTRRASRANGLHPWLAPHVVSLPLSVLTAGASVADARGAIAGARRPGHL